MTAGLPATGIGGVFYILLVLAMPLRELWFTVKGRSSLARWRVVAQSFTLAALIVASLIVEFKLIAMGLQYLLANTWWGQRLQHTGAFATATFSSFVALSPFVIIATLLAGMHVLRFTVKRPRAHIT